MDPGYGAGSEVRLHPPPEDPSPAGDGPFHRLWCPDRGTRTELHTHSISLVEVHVKYSVGLHTSPFLYTASAISSLQIL